jgi:hypothetical protein
VCAQLLEMKYYAEIKDVELEPDQVKEQVTLIGTENDVLQVQSDIKDIVMKAKEQEHASEKEEMFANIAKWYFIPQVRRERPTFCIHCISFLEHSY